MSNLHFLTRNHDNEHICGGCGFRPAILDDPAPIGRLWKAQSAVFEHIKAMPQSHVLRSPHAPFTTKHDRRYPRAGVRRDQTGEWVITLWDEDGVMHAWENHNNALHPNWVSAFEFAQWFILVHHESGVRLNGMASA